MDNTENRRGLRKPCKYRIPVSVRIWVLISLMSVLYTGSQASSTMEIVNQTISVNASDIQVMATVMVNATTVRDRVTTVTTVTTEAVNETLSTSTVVPLPSNCYQVCLCNSSVMASHTVSMAYNMSEQATYTMNMTSNFNMTPTSWNTVTSSTLNLNLTPSPSSVNMSYTATANATTMSYNSSVWTTPSASPVECSRNNCWIEVKCRTHAPSMSMTRYVAPTTSVAPTQPTACQGVKDCNGDCNGIAYEDCGVCIEGNTGNSSLRDCENECNGTAEKSNATCGVCVRSDDSNPLLDCNKTCNGDAKLDSCGICTGGNTGLTANYLKDACGVCNGDNSSCKGCDEEPNSGKVPDACQVCGGTGTTCTDIMKAIPRTIASCQPSILVFGAGLDAGVKTVCALYNNDNMVFNTTATSRNLTHARCEFASWVNYTVGEYNLSLTVVHNDKSDVKTNTSLRVYYYSCSNLSLTSASPNEVLIGDLPRNVTLVGSGFFDWALPEMVCYFGSQSTTDVIYVNASAVRCKIAAVGSSTRLSLSLSMDGGLKRVGYANLTVFHQAPNVTKAKFSETAAEILVSFDKDVEFAGDETCSVFFDSATVAKLGEDPECLLATTRELEIVLGTNASIFVGENLVFRNNIFKVRDQMFSRYLSGSFPVQSPDSPLTPVPEITGPTKLSSCGNLTLFGFLSSGGGGRPLKYQWSLKSPNSGSDFNNISSILNKLSKNADAILIPGTILVSEKTYEFQLGVANFLNPSTFVNGTHSVVKAVDPVPFLSLSSSIDLDDGEVYVSEDLSIKVTADVAPCVNDTRVSFLWTATCSDASAQQKVKSSSFFQLTKTRATLSIKKGVLTGDVTCKFNVTASMNYDPNVKSSVAVDIKARSTPLEPAIVGGDRQIGVADGPINLDASTQTVDPDGSSQTMRCSWKCRDQNDSSCFSAVEKGKLIFESASGCKIEVQSNQFTAGNNYTVSVDISKGSRTASTSVLLTVVAGNPPDVWVAEAKIKALAHERVALEGFYQTSARPDRVVWSCLRVTGFAYVDISNLMLIQQYNTDVVSVAIVVIPAGRLKKGSKYRFRLTVNDGSKDGLATMEVEVRRGPTSGSLTVDKSIVQALTEEVTMKAAQWTVEKDALPLRYAFGEIIEDDCVPWGPPSNILEWKGRMPSGSGPNNILSLCVIVEDKFESFAVATKNITSYPVTLSAGDLNTLFSDTVEDQLRSGNLDRALSSMRNIADTVKNSKNTSGTLKRNISQKAQDFIVDYLDSAVVDEENALPLFNALVNTDAAAAVNSSSMAGAAAKIIDGLGDKSLGDNQAEGIFKWMGDLAGDSLDEEDDGFLESLVNVLDELGENLAAELVLGDPAREVSDDRLGVVNVRVSSLTAELPISSKPRAPKFDPGEALAKQFGTPRTCGGGKNCSAVILKFVQHTKKLIKEDPNKQNNDSEIVNNQVMGLELSDPVDKKKLTVSGLSKPLKLTFNISTVPVDREATCSFFNETMRLWITDGLTAIGPKNGSLTCESSHATFFAPSHEKKSATNTTTTNTAAPVTTVGAKPAEEKSYTGAIVGGVIGGVVFIIIVVGVIWWCNQKKKEHTGRVSPENPPEPNA